MEIAAKQRQVCDVSSVGKRAVYVLLKSGAGPAYAGKWVVAILILNRNEVTFDKSLIGNTFFETEIIVSTIFFETQLLSPDLLSNDVLNYQLQGSLGNLLFGSEHFSPAPLLSYLRRMRTSILKLH